MRPSFRFLNRQSYRHGSQQQLVPPPYVLNHPARRTWTSYDQVPGSCFITEKVQRSHGAQTGGRQITVPLSYATEGGVLFRAGDEKGCTPAAFEHRVGQRNAHIILWTGGGNNPSIPLGKGGTARKQRGRMTVGPKAKQVYIKKRPGLFKPIHAVKPFELALVCMRRCCGTIALIGRDRMNVCGGNGHAREQCL